MRAVPQTSALASRPITLPFLSSFWVPSPFKGMPSFPRCSQLGQAGSAFDDLPAFAFGLSH